MSKQEDESTPRVELTIHCPKCRNVIGKDTKLCTNCGVEVDKVPSVDRPISPFRKYMGILNDVQDVDAYIEKMRGR